MSTVTDPQIRWEFPPWIQGSVSSDARDFERPRQPVWSSTVPTDINNAEAPSAFIKQVQTIMKSNPISPPYPGPIDGVISRKLLDVVLNFQWTLEKKTGQKVSIVKGESISPGGFAKAMKLLKDFTKEKSKEKVLGESSAVIKSFQEFLSTDQPVLGKLYSGPIDGKVNAELGAAAKGAEHLIAKAIGNTKVHGVIWNDSTESFNTSVNDVKSAIDVIVKHKSAEGNKNV